MAELVWTQDDVDTLKRAIKSGVLSVTYAGPPARSITYQSLPEMRSLLAEMVGQSGGRRRYRRVAIRKGFDRG